MSDEQLIETDAPFDLQKLQTLFELMEKHGLTEVNLRRGDERWRLRRGPQEVASVAPAAPFLAMPPAQTHAAVAARTEPSVASEPGAEQGLQIKSPTVGTFYSAPSPDDPPFVTVGTRVQPDTVVCLVEAMKVFNQIPAECSGMILEILVHNGDSVEFGQPLFRVQPN